MSNFLEQYNGMLREGLKIIKNYQSMQVSKLPVYQPSNWNRKMMIRMLSPETNFFLKKLATPLSPTHRIYIALSPPPFFNLSFKVWVFRTDDEDRNIIFFVILERNLKNLFFLDIRIFQDQLTPGTRIVEVLPGLLLKAVVCITIMQHYYSGFSHRVNFSQE